MMSLFVILFFPEALLADCTRLIVPGKRTNPQKQQQKSFYCHYFQNAVQITFTITVKQVEKTINVLQ